MSKKPQRNGGKTSTTGRVIMAVVGMMVDTIMQQLLVARAKIISGLRKRVMAGSLFRFGGPLN